MQIIPKSIYQGLNICNINFINNTGTALKLKVVTVYSTVYHFITTVYGGGMFLYCCTNIYLTRPLIFDKAIIGGEIYIATPELYTAYCTIFEQIIFSIKFGSTLGADFR